MTHLPGTGTKRASSGMAGSTVDSLVEHRHPKYLHSQPSTLVSSCEARLQVTRSLRLSSRLPDIRSPSTGPASDSAAPSPKCANACELVGSATNTPQPKILATISAAARLRSSCAAPLPSTDLFSIALRLR